MFNASKSKCMLFRPRKSSKYATVGTPDLSIGGNSIEYVEKWPHLGHMTVSYTHLTLPTILRV